MYEEEEEQYDQEDQEAWESYPFRFIFSLLLYEKSGEVMAERRDLEVMADDEHFGRLEAVRLALSEGHFVKDIRTDKKFKKKEK